MCLSKSFSAALRLCSSGLAELFLFSSFLKKSVTSVVRADPAEDVSSLTEELPTVLVAGVVLAVFIYFLKNYASSSTTISSLTVFFCTGGGIN